MCGIEEDNSMIKPNPFWDEVKVKKGTKIPHTDLEIDKAYVPNDKYFELITKLVGQINE